LDDLLNLAILDLAKLSVGNLLLGVPAPRLLQRRGAKQAADVVGAERRHGARRHYLPHTSSAISTTSRIFAHCCSSVRTLPSSVAVKPHCGESAICSTGMNLAASSRRRFTVSLLSSVPLFDVMTPTTTIFLPFGRKRSGSKPPARSLSYSRK